MSEKPSPSSNEPSGWRVVLMIVLMAVCFITMSVSVGVGVVVTLVSIAIYIAAARRWNWTTPYAAVEEPLPEPEDEDPVTIRMPRRVREAHRLDFSYFAAIVQVLIILICVDVLLQNRNAGVIMTLVLSPVVLDGFGNLRKLASHLVLFLKILLAAAVFVFAVYIGVLVTCGVIIAGISGAWR